MEFNEVSKLCRQLDYRDKFRLAQLLIQLGRKEEEAGSPKARQTTTAGSEDIQYFAERLLKLRPSRRQALHNSISAMFQFQGGISEREVDNLITELQQRGRIDIDDRGSVSYPEVA